MEKTMVKNQTHQQEKTHGRIMNHIQQRQTTNNTKLLGLTTSVLIHTMYATAKTQVTVTYNLDHGPAKIKQIMKDL